jgi:hypothetical protein
MTPESFIRMLRPSTASVYQANCVPLDYALYSPYPYTQAAHAHYAQVSLPHSAACRRALHVFILVYHTPQLICVDNIG